MQQDEASDAAFHHVLPSTVSPVMESVATSDGVETEDIPARRSLKRERLYLNTSDYPELAAQLAEMKKYFVEPLSTTRRGERLADSTVDTTERRVLSTCV